MTSQGKPFYVGSFRHTLDVKNRVTVPSKWRFAGDESCDYLALPHPDGYIMVLPPVEVERLYDKASSQLFSDESAQAFLHKFFSQGHLLGIDKQGRLNLPEELIQHCGLGKSAVLVGSMNKFSIWSPDRWDAIDPRNSGENLGTLMKQIGL